MATHDYDIANQSGAAFRTDLNNALAAIQSNNSNSSSPATTVAYQFWADTSAGTLKIRNAANNDWIELFELDGTLLLEDGSESSPALAFRDDTNTGIFSSANDHLSIVTGGTERIRFQTSGVVLNDGAADYDIRVEGTGDTNLLKVDAGNNRIGIGTSTPEVTLDVVAGSGTPQIHVSNTATNGEAAFAVEGKNSSGTVKNMLLKYDNSDKFRLATSSATSFQIETSDSPRLTVASGGAITMSGDLTVSGNLNAVSDYLEFKHFDFGTIAAGASETATISAPKNNEQVYLEIRTVGRENTNSGTFVMRSDGLANFAGTTKQTVGIGDFSADESLGEADYRTFSGGSHGLDYDGNNLRLTVTNSGSGTMTEVITLVRYQWSD